MFYTYFFLEQFLYICLYKTIIMTTITINERTKAGKALLELANLLASSNKGVIINVGLGKPVLKKTKVLDKSTETKNFSKTVNKNMTKKLFAKFNLDYDSYNR